MYLGYFDITSDKVLLTDPCYDLDVWCMIHLDNVKKGKWIAYVNMSDEKDWGIRVGELLAYRVGYAPDSTAWEMLEGQVGVDSGQAGIFDGSIYKKDLIEPYVKVNKKKERDSFWVRLREEALEELERNKELERVEEELETSGDINITGLIDLNKKRRERYERTIRDCDHHTNQPAEETTEWYWMCCDKTDSKGQASVIPGGVVSSSGFGDGGYSAYAVEVDGEIVAIKIVFIGDDEEDVDYCDDCGNDEEYCSCDVVIIGGDEE